MSTKRVYKNLPHPTDEPGAFNEYLRKNNKVIEENISWILIENSYIDDELVCFCKLPFAYMDEIGPIEQEDLAGILRNYKDNKTYINATKDKSVADRLHWHIEL